MDEGRGDFDGGIAVTSDERRGFFPLRHPFFWQARLTKRGLVLVLLAKERKLYQIHHSFPTN